MQSSKPWSARLFSRRTLTLAAVLPLAALATVGFNFGCGEPPPAAPAAATPEALQGAQTAAPAPAPRPTGAEVAPAPAPISAPASGPITAGSIELITVADTSIAGYPQGVRSATAKNSEQSFNYGKSTRIKIKRQENMGLFRFDFSKVPAGATITSAEMIVTMDNGKAFNHVGAYSMHVDWNEGEGKGNGEDTDKAQTDADTGACFLGPKGPKTLWREYADSDFSHAAAGNGGNATGVSRAKNLGNDKWSIPIDPAIVEAAMVDGQTICLNDETGAWGDDYSNAYVCSREAGDAKAPVLKLSWSGDRDAIAPAFTGMLEVETGPWPGSLILRLPAAGDDGATGVAVGYHVMIDGKMMPTVQVPRPSRFHREMFVTDLTPGKEVAIDVAAFDEAGNTTHVTAQATTGAVWAKKFANMDWPTLAPEPAQGDAFTVRVVDGLTLFDPLTGGLTPDETRVNSGKPAEEERVQKAVQGDILGFQVLVQLKDKATSLPGVKLRLSDFTSKDGGLIAGATAIFQREHYVHMKIRKTEAWIADPLPVLGKDELLAIPSQDNLEGQKMAAVYVDLHVPLTTQPGLYSGSLIVSPGGDAADITVPMAIQVEGVALPDMLSFVVEMNAYGHAEKQMFWDVYRLFHAHRLSYNVLSYGHTKGPDPRVLPLAGEGKTLHVSDWSAYDALYGPLFTGEVAKGLPRDGAPATHWYLPFHEGWPVELGKTDPNRICWEGRVAPKDDKKAYEAWLDKCMVNDPLVADHFSDEWKDGNAAVVKQFAEHAKEKGWTKTSLQIFSNHKMYFDAGSMSLWVMDEPQYGRDYRALNWTQTFYNNLFKGSGLKVAMREDISRPAWVGDRIDSGLGTICTSGGLQLEHDMNTRRVIATGEPLWWYGGAGDAATDPAAMSALFLRTWGVGCDGGLPNWTAMGGPQDWTKTDGLRYITYDPKTGVPVATFRMKACREGQELIELLNQLSHKPGFNRWMVHALVEQQFPVEIVTISKNPDDPGYSVFKGLDYAALDALRTRVIATLEAAK